MTKDYKFEYAEIAAKVTEYSKQIEANGKEPMAQFADSILSIIKNKNGYMKFGVYWFAVKKVLKANTKKDLGEYSVQWLEDEYSFAVDGTGFPKSMTPAMILVAAYEFATNEGYLGGSISAMPIEDYEIDGVLWSIVDEDMLK